MEEEKLPIPIEVAPLKGVSLRTFYTVISSTVIIMLYINNMGNKIDKLTDKVGYGNDIMEVKIRAVQQRQDLIEIDMKELKRQMNK